jgi:hypothetical protein
VLFEMKQEQTDIIRGQVFEYELIRQLLNDVCDKGQDSLAAEARYRVSVTVVFPIAQLVAVTALYTKVYTKA